MSTWRRLLSLALAACMLLSVAAQRGLFSTKTAQAAVSSNRSAAELIDIDPSTLNVKRLGETEEEKKTDLSFLKEDAEKIVRATIFFTEPAAIDKGFDLQSIGSSRDAQSYRQMLRKNQEQMITKIEKRLNYSLDVKWHLTLVANAVSVNVKFGDILKISLVEGVKSVEIETQYVPQTEEADSPNTAVTGSEMTGAADAWTQGYTGAGTKIAIIDTGIDYTHISFDGDAFEYAIAQYEAEFGTEIELFTEADYPEGLNVAPVYISSKIPYAYNYVDGNTEVSHAYDQQGNHGSHVAGIAAANRFVPVKTESGVEFADAIETVAAAGMAPDAQLFIMKVFGATGGAYQSDYMTAIEDALTLGCDSVNLSLGSGSPGFSFAGSYGELMNTLSDKAANAGLVMTVSMGNAYSFPEFNSVPYIYTTDASLHTGGSPGSYVNSFTVASADNIGTVSIPLVFNGDILTAFTENYPADYAGSKITENTGTYDFVYIDGVGEAAEYAAVNEQIPLAGKVVVVNRGSLSFFEKGNNAIDYAPLAVVVANNADGKISMNLTGYTGSFPMVAITLAAANQIKAAVETAEIGGYNVYTGTVEITDVPAILIENTRDNASPSEFSSYGIPGSLLLKPEITAPGGSIYSVYGYGYESGIGFVGGSDQYESFSGTSMAAPHIAGLNAVLAQYMKAADFASRNPELTEKYSLRAIQQSLLMSTATPMFDSYGDLVSLLRQGAGLADVSLAIDSHSVVMIDPDGTSLTALTGAAADGKVKVELGDDPDREGKYSYTFTIYNLEDVDLEFEVASYLMIQYPYYGYMLPDTLGLAPDEDYYETVEWAQPFMDETESHDVNKDGVTDDADAQALLDYIAGNITADGLDLEAGELDGEEGLTTYDAYLLLNWVPDGYLEDGMVPANGSRSVTVTIEIDEYAKQFIEYYYPNGTYIEGFTEAYCVSETEDGGYYADDHTIPMIAFYGSWTDPSMFENNSYAEALYGNTNEPYGGSTNTNYLSIMENGVTSKFVGNPYAIEDSFPYERLAIRSDATIRSFTYTLIRGAGTTGYAISRIDEDGLISEVINSSVNANQVIAMYPDIQTGVMTNTAAKVYMVNRTPASYGLADGDLFRAGVYAFPEYYGLYINGTYGGDYTGGYAGSLSDMGFAQLIYSGMYGDGAFMGYDLTVDDTAPEILSVELAEDNTLSFSASDNQNLAYVAIISVDGTVIYFDDVPADAEYEISFDASDIVDEAEGYVAIFAADYAGNEAAKALRVNDGAAEEYVIYVLTSEITAGEEYLIVNTDEAGDGLALGYTGSTVATNDVTVNPAYSNIEVPYINSADVAETSVWTAAGSVVFENNGNYLAASSRRTLEVSGTPTEWTWDGENNRLYLDSSSVYYIGCSFSVFNLSKAKSSVYLYQKTVISVDNDPTVVTEISINPTELYLYKGGEAYITAKVSPLVVEDRTVTWSSSDPAVATVDENGHVQAVSEGTAVITATSNQDNTFTADCDVTVISIDKDFNAAIWDEEGYVFFSEFNMNGLPAWKKLHSEGGELPIHSVLVADEGLYAGTLDSNNGTSVMFLVNDDYSLEEVAENYLWMTDMAIGLSHPVLAPSFGMVYGYGPYIIGGNLEPVESDEGYFTGMPYAISSLSRYNGGAYVAGVACYERSSTWSDYLVLDENGDIWYTYMIYMGSSVAFATPQKVFETGISTSFLYQSLYFDGTYLYWSHQDGSYSTMYVIDLENGIMYEAGNFGEDVWPAAGLYEAGIVGDGLASADTSVIAKAKAGAADPASVTEADLANIGRQEISADEIYAINCRFVAEAAKEAAKVQSAAGGTARAELGFKRPDKAELMAIVAAADEADPAVTGITYTAEADQSNGLINVTYDPEEVELTGVSGLTAYSSLFVDEENGKIRLAFAKTDDDLYAEDDVIATFTFTALDCELDAPVTVATEERGDELGLDESEDVTVAGYGHKWGEPEWIWDGTDSATVSFICENDSKHVYTETVEAVKTVKAVEGEDGSVTYSDVYTVTVTGPDGETYTDSKSEAQTILLNGVSLTLEGEISINFYLVVPDSDIFTGAKAYLDYEYAKTADGFINHYEFALDKSANYDADAKEYKLVFPDIAAKEMTEDVILTVKDAEGRTLALTHVTKGEIGGSYAYCVADWANNVLANENSSDKAKNVARALLNYGQYAQEHFVFNTEDPAYPEKGLESEMAAVTVGDEFAPVIPRNSKANAGYVGATLMLQGSTSIRLYFSKEITAVNENGESYNVYTSGSRWYVEIENIAAKDLDTVFTVIVTADGTQYEFRYGAFSYVRSVLSSSSTDEKLKNVCRALVLYNEAAKAYFA